MADALTVTYGEVTISYDEDRDRWLYTLNGKDRSAETLANAKKAIDAVPKPKRAAFQRIAAYKLSSYEIAPEKVEITSVAEQRGYSSSGVEVWITGQTVSRYGGTKTERSRVPLKTLVEISPQNDARLAQMQALKDEIEERTAQIEELRKELVRIQLPEDSEAAA